MPTLCWSSPLLKSTADGLSLGVEITHELQLGAEDETVLKIQKFPPPESLDILSSSSIFLRLTGSFEMKQVPTETLRGSSLVAYLLEYFKFHSAQLYISSVSDPYVNADGILEVAVASSRALLDPDELPVTTATLIAINCSFAWKSNSAADTCVNPFSSQHLLPIQSLVNSVIEKVLSRDFVRRYPLIFGSWRNSLCAEMDMFPQVAQPILNIISRSQNPAFRKQCRKFLRSLRRSNDVAFQNSSDTLQDALGSLTLDDVSVSHEDDETVLLISLQRLYRTLFRTERFKTSTFITKSDDRLHSSDNFVLSSDVPEYNDPKSLEGLDGLPLGFDETAFVDLFTESKSSQDIGNIDVLPVTHCSSAEVEALMLRTTQPELIRTEETTDTRYLFEKDADGFTLAGLDDWDSIDLQTSLAEKRLEPSLRSDGGLGCIAPDLDAPRTEPLYHKSALSGIPRFHDLGATLDQHLLDLDSDEGHGDMMDEEEMVLDF